MHTDAIFAWVLALALVMLGVGHGIGSNWEGGSSAAVTVGGLFFAAIATGVHIGVANARYEKKKEASK